MMGLEVFFTQALFTVSSAIRQLAICAAIFMPLALLFPSKPSQPLVHKGMIPDVLYWLFGAALIYGPVSSLMGNALYNLSFDMGIYSIADLNNLRLGLPPLANLPILLQAVLILVIMDCIQYWTH